MRIVIVGAGGRLGAALVRAYQSDHEVVGFNHAQLDLGAPDEMREKIDALRFDVLINCAGQTNVDRCEAELEEAFAINSDAPGVLAAICAAQSARLIHISTDYVFDGEKAEPYLEEDEAKPISVYGQTKLDGERRVLAVSEKHLVVRVSWVFGPDRPSFIDWVVEQARERDEVSAVADKFSTPTYTHDIEAALLWLLKSDASGIFHFANGGRCSWQEYGQWALDCCRVEGVELRAENVAAISLADMKQFVARRPVSTALSTEKYQRITGQTPRHWHEAVREYVREHIASGREV